MSAATAPAAASVAARYYPAMGQAGALAAQLSVADEAGVLLLSVEGEVASRRIAVSELKASERFRRATRNVQLADGSVLEIDDGAQLSRVLTAAGQPDAMVTRWQHSWRTVVISLALSVVLAVAGYIWVLPVAAEQFARRVPPSWTEALDDMVIGQLTRQGSLQSTALTTDEQQRLRARFASAVASVGNVAKARKVSVHFFKIGNLPNAFALPGGSIVFLDGIVKLAPDDDALVGVFAHEFGHVQHRHGLRMLLRSAVISALAAWYFADFTTLANAAIIASQLKYSRDFETEADDTALEIMRANQLDTKSIATLFRRLRDHGDHGADSDKKDESADAKKDRSAVAASTTDTKGEAVGKAPRDRAGRFSIPEFLSTHPDVDRRIERFAAAAKKP